MKGIADFLILSVLANITSYVIQLCVAAADGCLQYFTGVSGQMFSFNYNDATGLQLSNTDYTMCVRMERNFCGIQYTACPDPDNSPPQSFSVTGGSPTLGSVVGTEVQENKEQQVIMFHTYSVPRTG